MDSTRIKTLVGLNIQKEIQVNAESFVSLHRTFSSIEKQSYGRYGNHRKKREKKRDGEGYDE